MIYEWFIKLFKDHILLWIGLGLGFLLGLQWLGYRGFTRIEESIIIFFLAFGLGAVIVIIEKGADNDSKKGS